VQLFVKTRMKTNRHSRVPSSDQNNPTAFIRRMWTEQVTCRLSFTNCLDALLPLPPFF